MALDFNITFAQDAPNMSELTDANIRNGMPDFVENYLFKFSDFDRSFNYVDNKINYVGNAIAELGDAATRQIGNEVGQIPDMSFFNANLAGIVTGATGAAYQFLPSGVLIQFGSVNVNLATTTVYYPIPFPAITNCVVATVSTVGADPAPYFCVVQQATSERANFSVAIFNNAGTRVPGVVRWIAIGK